MGCKILPLLILAFAVVFVKAHDQQRSIQIGINVATKIIEGFEKCIQEQFGKISKIFYPLNEAIKLIITKLPEFGKAILSFKKQLYKNIIVEGKKLLHYIVKIFLKGIVILIKMTKAIIFDLTKICDGGNDKIIEVFEKLEHILGPLLGEIGGGGSSNGTVGGIGIPGIKIPGY